MTENKFNWIVITHSIEEYYILLMIKLKKSIKFHEISFWLRFFFSEFFNNFLAVRIILFRVELFQMRLLIYSQIIFGKFCVITNILSIVLIKAFDKGILRK